MAYIVYITENCQKEAEKHGYKHDLQRLKDSIEKNQTTVQLERFGSTKYSVKRKIGSFRGRLVTCEEQCFVHNKEYTVIIFLTLFIRAATEYKNFHRNPEAMGEKLVSKIAKSELQSYLEKAIAENPPAIKKPLSDEEKSYLYSAAVTDYELDNEALVYESEQWVNAISQDSSLSILHNIYRTVSQIYGDGLNDVYERQILDRTEKIVFCLDKDKKRLSLINLVTAENFKGIDVTAVVKKWNQDLEKHTSVAKRAYPQYILADDTLWMAIEKEPQSNFILSKEEIKILEKCAKEEAFPLFINGRAGSGKSTVLQYLFADYFSRFISYRGSIKHPPVYFTYNSRLLELAKANVKAILNHHHSFAEQGNANVSISSDTLKNSFKELKTYLLSTVPESDRERFNGINYIAFSYFHDLWLEKFKADRSMMRSCSPEISWYVIRTYIQGMDADGYLEPEDYEEVEEKQKTVSMEAYKEIYDKVWKWYKGIKQEGKFWDDQDLARYVIENDLAKPTFPGIFCDEAQDFTRVDLEVIFRLSIFTDRELQKQNISKIPFVFAGDELQTINPTGFRWEALKAGFTQKFILSPSSTTREPINLNYHELENNYRSLPPIVKFCNTLQLFRAVRFKFSGLRPQTPWRKSDINVPVMYFDANDAGFWAEILKLADTVFIIPCEEGQEVEWVKNDSELSKHITFENNVPNWVLSASHAKGLEFNRVVVYGFGKNAPKNIITPSNSENTSVTLPLEYYINKTYVAISRAKKQLFIVDSGDAIRNLWEATQESTLLNRNIEQINSGNAKHWSSDDIISLEMGYGYSVSMLENNETGMEENAQQFIQNGISNRSSYMLKQAALCYEILERKTDADRYKAYAYVFDKKYFEAGETALNSGLTDIAIKSFWLANSMEGYKKIAEKTKANPHYKIFHEIASAATSSEKDTFVDVIASVAEISNDSLYSMFKGDEIFRANEIRNILSEIINSIVKKLIPLITINDEPSLLYKIIDIHKKGIIIDTASIAEIAYTLKEYKTAVESWDKSESKDKEKYIISRAYCAEFPDNILLLGSIGKHEDIIIEQYNKNEKTKLSDDHLLVVIKAFLVQKNTDKALQICTSLTSSEIFNHVFNEYSSHSSENSDKKYKSAFLALKKISRIREKGWDDIWKMLSSEDTKNDPQENLYVAASLARLDSWHLLAEAGRHPSEKDISGFLREKIIIKYTQGSINIPEEIVIDIGTAIEKAGHRRDALSYYEYAESCTKNEEAKQKCVERWIKVKERQAESTDDEELADKRRQDAVVKRQSLEIPKDKFFAEYETLSEWPELYQFVIKNETTEKSAGSMELKPPKQDNLKPKFVVKAVPKEPTANGEQSQSGKYEFDFHGFKMAYFYSQKRLNITEDNEGKTISIKIGGFTTDDYSLEEVIIKGAVYQSVKGTAISFQNKDRIRLYFTDIRIGMDFDASN
ncbi:MAG: hypothetical protein FWB99_03090 [Treponema sp.]|nr:hypothetical protein [Treponema sp.]